MASSILEIDSAFALSKWRKDKRHSLMWGSCGDDRSTNLKHTASISLLAQRSVVSSVITVNVTGFGKNLRIGSVRNLWNVRFYQLRSKFVKVQILSYISPTTLLLACRLLWRLVNLYKGKIILHFDLISQPSCRTRSLLLRIFYLQCNQAREQNFISEFEPILAHKIKSIRQEFKIGTNLLHRI